MLILFPMSGSEANDSRPPFDAIISGALIYDGVKNEPFRADIALKGDRIAAIGKFRPGDAVNWVDAGGLWAVPGFIDTHTHSDFNPLVYPGLPNKITQGITTEISGNCGMSAAPIKGSHGDRIQTLWAREGVRLPAHLPWQDVEGYAHALRNAGMITNMKLLAGHGNLRSAVAGFREGKLTQEELGHIKGLLREAMNQGAAGISFGLVYLPGIFADEKEITELCGIVREYDGVCSFHMRSEGSTLVESVEEAIRVGTKTGARIEISHLKAAGVKNWPKIEQVFRLIEDARRNGVRVSADAYPYTAGFAELGVVLPDALFIREDRTRLFTDPSGRQALIQELTAYYQSRPRDWSAVRVASVTAQEDKQFQGMSIADISQQTALPEPEVLVNLLARSQFEVSAFNFSQSAQVVGKVIDKPYVFAGSDSIADGIEVPHPRAYGTFPLLIRRALGEQRENFGSFIKRLTSEPADFFALEGRGIIQEGYYADLVLFNPQTVADTATYDKPASLSRGIEWVFVNGGPAVQNGRYEGAKTGRFLTRSAA